tara:strand:- start:1138 stop:1656 length:519 start_codon:yes stop_codon:yes gene_type:complete
MGIETRIIDNFLPEEEFSKLSNTIISKNFPFHIFNKVTGNEVDEDSLPFWYYYGIHMIYSNNEPKSDWFKYFNNMLSYMHDQGLGLGLCRIKVNFYPYTDTVYEHDQHTDYDYPMYGAVLSLNTCNGFTRLADGTKVDSVANRLLIFDSSKNHNSSTTSNATGRYNVNFNFR